MIFESENMKKSIYSTLTRSYPWTDTKKWTGLCLMLLLTGLTINYPVWARGGHDEGSVIGGGGDAGRGGGFSGGHQHSNRSHSHYNLGIGFGGFYGPGLFGPGFFGSGYYSYPSYPYPYRYRYPGAYYYPRSYYSSPSIIAPSAPVIYIQRETPVTSQAQPVQTSYWYYCRNPEGYYPYIKQCPEGWLQVAPQPTPQ
jgi:hypothetical protein